MNVVALAGSGLDAVRTCLDIRPNIAVLTQVMPGMNGIEAARMIRERCSETRIVMLSMYVIATRSATQGGVPASNEASVALLFEKAQLMETGHPVFHVPGANNFSLLEFMDVDGHDGHLPIARPTAHEAAFLHGIDF